VEHWQLNIHSSKLLGNRHQNTKNVNNWWNCQHVSVAVFSCKQRERRERQVFKYLNQIVRNVARFQVVKALFRKEILFTSLGICSRKVMELNLKKLVKFGCCIKQVYLFLDSIKIFPVPVLICKYEVSNSETNNIFWILWNFFRCVSIEFYFLFRAMWLLFLCFVNTTFILVVL
jgi:hypothetical protein